MRGSACAFPLLYSNTNYDFEDRAIVSNRYTHIVKKRLQLAATYIIPASTVLLNDAVTAPHSNVDHEREMVARLRLSQHEGAVREQSKSASGSVEKHVINPKLGIFDVGCPWLVCNIRHIGEAITPASGLQDV